MNHQCTDIQTFRNNVHHCGSINSTVVYQTRESSIHCQFTYPTFQNIIQQFVGPLSHRCIDSQIFQYKILVQFIFQYYSSRIFQNNFAHFDTVYFSAIQSTLQRFFRPIESPIYVYSNISRRISIISVKFILVYFRTERSIAVCLSTESPTCRF